MKTLISCHFLQVNFFVQFSSILNVRISKRSLYSITFRPPDLLTKLILCNYLGNALLGTASGIIILGIIIGLIFFVRKRSRNNSERDNGGEYKVCSLPC